MSKSSIFVKHYQKSLLHEMAFMVLMRLYMCIEGRGYLRAVCLC